MESETEFSMVDSHILLLAILRREFPKNETEIVTSAQTVV